MRSLRPNEKFVTAEAMPLVSVIIPTHNSASFVAQAVQGVLEQTYRRQEVIVVDDGSCDETRDVLRAFAGQIRYCHQENRGPAAARNTGIRLAGGQYVCFLDADDWWAPEKLELQTDFMEAHTDIGLSFTDAEEWEGTTIHKRSIVATMIVGMDVVSQIPLQDAFRKLLVENFIPTSTVMMRTACFAKAGMFDEDLPNAEDRDLWLRVAADSSIACLPRVLARKRSHGANISTRTEAALRSRLKVWEKARRQYPTLAPASVYQKLLASNYQELGYIFLTKGEGSDARRAGVVSLGYAIRHVASTKSLFPYRWWLSIGLVPLSFMWWPLVRSLWLARNYLLRRNAPEAASWRWLICKGRSR